LQLIDLTSEIKFNPAKLTERQLFSSLGLKINLYCLEEGQKLEVSDSPQPLIWYCVGGIGHFYYDSQRISATFGTLLICECNSYCCAKGKDHFVILEIRGKQVKPEK